MKAKLHTLLLVVPCLLVWLPLWMLLTGAITGPYEWGRILRPLALGNGTILFPPLPRYPTLAPLVEALVDTPAFWSMFWNSCRLVFPVVAGQVLVGAPAGWALTRMRFPGRRALSFLYIALMLLPFQVTMVSSYLVLDAASLIDTRWAVILPGVFSPFAVFIMMRGFGQIPESVLEAARLDGAGTLRCFTDIGLPLGAPGILSAVILNFLEYWALLEQPLTFFRDKSLWPLSLFLAPLSAGTAGAGFVAALLILLPPLFVFLFGQHDLERGIAAAGIKE